MKKFVQICASQNDLFALDEDGAVYRHNFNTKAWVKLPHSPSDAEAPEPADVEVSSADLDPGPGRT